MKRRVSLVLIAVLMFAGAAAQAEEINPPPAAPTATPSAPVVNAPKPPAPAAVPAPVTAPKPVPPAEREKPAVASPPAAHPDESERSGDMPVSRENRPAAEPSATQTLMNSLGAFLWPAFSFAMLIAGFVAGYAWRHHVSRHKLGGMTVRIGTWRGTP